MFDFIAKGIFSYSLVNMLACISVLCLFEEKDAEGQKGSSLKESISSYEIPQTSGAKHSVIIKKLTQTLSLS